MKGALINYTCLGALMRNGRELAGINLAEAALLLGLSSGQYLGRCELGVDNFPFAKIKRACKAYRIPLSSAVDAAVEDYRIGMDKALTEKKENK